VNPLHTDDSFAAQTRFGRRIVPGLLTASLLTHIGGLWNFLATEMRFEFLGPVYVGDTVTAVAIIAELSDKGWVRLDCTITNMNGEAVLRAQIKGYPGQFEE
jgi:3-hydroxybutyryl-CoA dehydratase